MEGERESRMSSCCAGSCGCGDACSCGTECAGGGCKMTSDMPEERMATAETVIPAGVEPQKEGHGEGSETGGVGGENRGCKCGSSCTCNPCECK